MLAEAQRITSSPRRLMAQMTGASLMTSGAFQKQQDAHGKLSRTSAPSMTAAIRSASASNQRLL